MNGAGAAGAGAATGGGTPSGGNIQGALHLRGYMGGGGGNCPRRRRKKCPFMKMEAHGATPRQLRAKGHDDLADRLQQHLQRHAKLQRQIKRVMSKREQLVYQKWLLQRAGQQA